MNKLILSSIFCILTLNSMAQQKIVQTAGRDQLGEFAPEFARLNDDILFGEVWSRNDLLSLRDRSLVTLTALISQGMTDSSLTYKTASAGRRSPKSSPTSPSTPGGPRHGRPSAWPRTYGPTTRPPRTPKPPSSER